MIRYMGELGGGGLIMRNVSSLKYFNIEINFISSNQRTLSLCNYKLVIGILPAPGINNLIF